MGKLHALLAARTGLKTAFAGVTATVRGLFDDRKSFVGIRKSYDPYDEKARPEPDETKRLGTTVGEELKKLMESAVPLIDANFQIDLSNLKAVADLEIPGTETIKDMPATALMQLENTLNELKGLIWKIPTLEDNLEWKAAEATMGKGVFQADGKFNLRTKTKLKFKEISPATDRHPAQVKTWNEDEAVGDYKTTVWSGMLSARAKSEIMQRLTKLQMSVIAALSKANDIAHANGHLGETLFSYLLEGIPLER